MSSYDDEQAVEKSKKTKNPQKPKSEAINYQAVVDLYNEVNEETGSRLPGVVALNDERKRAIKKFLGSLKEPTVEMAGKYFNVFFQDIKPHHLGENDRGWRASFDFAIRPAIVLRVREGNL